MYSLKDHILDYIDGNVVFSVDKVNLCNIARNSKELDSSRKTKIVFDADSCLDRLTGGFFPDWQSGGEWVRLNYFYTEIKKTCQNQNLEIVIFFNGTVPSSEECHDWHKTQLERKAKVKNIYKSNGQVDRSNWIEPSFSIQSIVYEINRDLFDQQYQNKFKHIDKCVFSYYTLEDHNKEIIDYCLKNECDCLLTNDFELITLFLIKKNLEKYQSLNNLTVYSAKSFKITRAGEMSAVRFNLDCIENHFKFNIQQFGLFSILLGTRWFPNEWLNPFYYQFYNQVSSVHRKYLMDIYCLIKKIAGYVKEKGENFNIDEIASEIFCSRNESDQLKIEQIKKNMNYLFRDDYDENYRPWISQFNQLKKLNCYKKLITDTSGIQIQNIEMKSSIDEKENEQEIENSTEKNLLKFNSFLNKLKNLHMHCLKNPNIYSLLTKRIIYLPVILESEFEQKNSNDIFRPIREGCYSLLFSGTKTDAKSEKNNENNIIKVEEILFDSKSNSIEKHLVQVKLFSTQLILKDIWKKYDRHGLFYKCLQIENKFFHFEVFQDHKYLIACLVLRYLIEKTNYFTKKYIEAFLATFLFFNQYNEIERKNNDVLKNKKRDMIATNLSALFLKGIETMSLLNDICGNPIKPYYFFLKYYFDGLAFQKIFKLIDSDDQNIFNKINNSKSFHELFNFVTISKLNSLNLEKVVLNKNTNQILNNNLDSVRLSSESSDSSDKEFKNKMTFQSNKISFGRGLIAKKDSLVKNKITTLYNNISIEDKFSSFKLNRKGLLDQSRNTIITSNRNFLESNLNNYHKIRASSKSPKNENKIRNEIESPFSNEYLHRFPIEHVKLQDEVMRLSTYLTDPEPKPKPKLSLRYVFHDKCYKNPDEKYVNEEVDITQPEEKVYPEFCKYEDLPIGLIDYEKLVQRKEELLKKIEELKKNKIKNEQ